MDLSSTAQKAIDAYGGRQLWEESRFAKAEVSVEGALFTLKRRPFFKHARLELELDRPFSKITPIGTDSNITGVLDGIHVHLESRMGSVLGVRANARMYFPYRRRLFYWDAMDMAYFANYAFWNYFTLPKLLMNEDIKWIEKAPGNLKAFFPDNIPTHCREQEFIFDLSSGLLKQHNYTANVVSKLAKAAHVINAHKMGKTGLFPSERVVTPRNGRGKPLKGPKLIKIEVHDFQLI